MGNALRQRSSKAVGDTISEEPKHEAVTNGVTHADGAGDHSRALLALFILAIALMITLFSNKPELSATDLVQYEALKFPPRSVDDLRALSDFLSSYRDQHFSFVLAGFCALYIFLQMFAIPGAIFLSILAGPLFGVGLGLLIVSIVATTGASMCFLMSHYLARGVVQRCLPGLLANFRSKIQQHRHNLFFYLLFLRVSPLLPNWFISVASPILHIPLLHFFMATLIGLMPANYLHVTTGLTLSQLQSINEATVNKKAIATLFVVAFLALLPTLFRKKFDELDAKFGQTKQNGHSKPE
jgi:uncharacterized membrane protein YdjX (TVP38/TMEM64 family)